MKLSIFKEPSEAPKEEKHVRLRLVKEGWGISVVAIDERGERVRSGYLLEFMPDGKIHRSPSINDTIGFDLDSQGRILIKE